VFCRERSERFRNTPWEMPRAVMAGEIVGVASHGCCRETRFLGGAD